METEKNELKTQLAVIGAGHAGIEAALAAARMGVDTVLFTLSLDAVANMPCNPSIGGTAKGHLVFEIDALGGEMGRAADLVTLQSRTLNTGKGAAVQSKRVQADRKQYQRLMKHTLETTPHLRLVQAEIVALRTETDEAGRKYVVGLETRLGEVWSCRAAVIATGTYLEGTVFVGNVSYDAGPDGLLPAKGLSASLLKEGISLRRFKTGTPARINRRSIDFSKIEEQKGEEHPIPFSALTDSDYLAGTEQLSCHIVYTNAETHRVILDNLTRSAMYSGKIHGTGPRYCPSIEDKLVRFADKERHQLFVEPLGKDTEEMYLQGFSTSLPTDVQHAMLRTLPGFEQAEIMRYAYAIEYDCADPTQMNATLEFKQIDGLFGAGQFNEPYRMMTSRSEYRLLLRQDNADSRLTPLGHRVGLIDEARFKEFEAKQVRISAEKARLEQAVLSPAKANAFLECIGETPLKSGASLADLLRRPSISYAQLAEIDKNRPFLTVSEQLTVESDIKYAGYAARQIGEVKRHIKLEEKKLPADIDYKGIKGLRIEAAQKLDKIRPLTIGQASAISGVNPADISVLLIYLGLH